MSGVPKGKSRRSRSSDRWLREHHGDPFVRAARTGGWRSRAVFKLEEIDRRERLLKAGAVCLDLGAAPGAWSQYARGRVGARGRVIASDILPMPALAGVEFVQGDFRETEVIGRILALLGDGKADALLSDMAPDLSGVDVIDQPRAMYLAELALEFADRVLKPGGTALIKLFQGSGFEELVRAARGEFGRVKLVKPEASRPRSPEIYLLAMQFRLV
jgi:23S rRNA (uridine2552-2'-O)-methyltransferase